ncbi:MAG TPA: hypothetical protein VN950_19135 [Terriglobales bacterium]|nr:hypothetical protein [Terriglobales bacterium]
MPHLLFHVHDRGSALNQQRPKRMPQIVKPDLADACLGEHRQKEPVVQIVGVEDRAIWRGEYQLVRNVILSLEESFQQPLVPYFDEHAPQFS